MKLLKNIVISCAISTGVWAVSAVQAEEVTAVKVSAPEQSATKGRDAVCLKCHEEKPVVFLFKTKHGVTGDTRTPACQSCHGESDTHLKDKKASPDVVFKKGTFAVSEVKAQNASCLACHDKDAKRTMWQGSAHQANDVACISCHTIHNEHDKVRDRKTQTETCFVCHKEQRTDSHKISRHPIAEGKVTCSDCHNLHGTSGPKLLKKNTINETCFTCHAEKRGPFLWEHQPVTESCSNCHSPHGSNITPLLKSRSPFLCSQCHDGPHASDSPVAGSAAGKQGGKTGSLSANVVGRGCMNCHSMVHGSNSPAGAILQR